MPKTQVTPYLFFSGRCQEALEFYQTALDAQVDTVMLFNQSPDPVPAGMLAEGFENKVMHAAFRIGETVVYGGDGTQPGQTFGAFSLVLALPTQADAERAFTALAEGGQVSMPLSKTFWSPYFGMVTDRFGIDWMVTLPMDEA